MKAIVLTTNLYFTGLFEDTGAASHVEKETPGDPNPCGMDAAELLAEQDEEELKCTINKLQQEIEAAKKEQIALRQENASFREVIELKKELQSSYARFIQMAE